MFGDDTTVQVQLYPDWYLAISLVLGAAFLVFIVIWWFRNDR